MTDENTVKENVSPENNAQEDGSITLEQLTVIKKSMLTMFQNNYKKFMESVREMPIHPQFMSQAFLFFDTAALWMKEIIEFAPLIQKKPENPAEIEPTETVQ